jgi:tRNA A37 threonylcarbamoyladenosine synthetase subunit TsaC/SUA5/YrdC
VPDAGSLLDSYGSRGLDFIVDVGQRATRMTSVVDMTGGEPAVVRAGKGDVSMFGGGE